MHDVPAVSADDVDQAAALIAAHVRRTPVIEDRGLVFKLELLQHSGSFKVRGAFNRVLSAEVPPAGLIAASGGNHGAAVSFVGQCLGLPVEVFMPAGSPSIKRALVERYGAIVTATEGFYDDAQRAADARQRETAALMVHPFDHPATVAGQGTMGRELEEQIGAFDTLLVATGGGGLIAGQAAWFGERVRIVSVETEGTQSLHAAMAAGEPVDVEVGGLASDSLGARRIGKVPWSVIRPVVHDAVLIDDDAVHQAQRALWDDFRLVVEPGGAAAYAAVRSGAYRPAAGERVVVVVCGSNCEPTTVMP